MQAAVARQGKRRKLASFESDMLGLLISAVFTLPGPDSKPESGLDSARQLARYSCVRVVNAAKNGRGSGVVIAARGAFLYVLTASHIVSGSNRIEVHLPTVEKDAKAKVVTDVDILVDGRTQDVALLRVSAGDVKVTLAPLTRVSPAGDEEFEAVSAGYGDSAEPDVRSERVLARKLLRRGGESWFAWECRDRPDTGRSGGALVDTNGRVIGVCSGTQDGKGYYTHADEIRALLKKKSQAWLLEVDDENKKK
jgi:S1-C subfamily serine protease